MATESAQLPAELPAVAALRTLSIFGADQGGAYREHYGRIAEALGADIPTRLGESARAWATAGTAGLRVLTGNAGTGKTAAAEAFCQASGGALPRTDALTEIAAGRFVIKDLSGLPGAPERLAAMEDAIRTSRGGAQVFVCANEGVMRDAAEQLAGDGALLLSLLERALREGAAEAEGIVVVNVNRQRPTAPELWDALVDYVMRQDLWDSGCEGCPHDAAGCPMRANAAALRQPQVRAALRTLVQIATGEAVPTLREVLAILAYAIVGGASCEEIRSQPEIVAAKRSLPRRLTSHGCLVRASDQTPRNGRLSSWVCAPRDWGGYLICRLTNGSETPPVRLSVFGSWQARQTRERRQACR